jgi:hypothetical protein
MIADEPLPKSAGRPPFEPSAEQRAKVDGMAACGIPQAQMALVIGIDEDTLRKHFRHELDTAAPLANFAVGKTLFAKAVGGDVTAAIWWSKTRMGWKEKQEIAHTDAEGKSLAVAFVTAPKSGTDAG